MDSIVAGFIRILVILKTEVQRKIMRATVVTLWLIRPEKSDVLLN